MFGYARRKRKKERDQIKNQRENCFPSQVTKGSMVSWQKSNLSQCNEREGKNNENKRWEDHTIYAESLSSLISCSHEVKIRYTLSHLYFIIYKNSALSLKNSVLSEA